MKIEDDLKDALARAATSANPSADAWERIERRSGEPHEPSAGKRVVVALLAAAIGLAGVVVATRAFDRSGGSDTQHSPAASRGPIASGSSPVASSWSSSTPFAPQPTDGQLPATFPDGTRVSLSMSDWSGMEEVVPFTAVYPVGGCGGSVLFGWDGLRDGVVDPTTEMRLGPPAESAVVFQGRGGWQPYYIALSADQWTALIPCSTSDSANAVASAQTIAKNVSLKVVDGWPVLSATDPVKLSAWSDEGGAPSLMFRFEPKTYLQVRPIHACLETGAVSAGVTQWCVRDADSGTVVLASAEGADSVVQRLINELGVGAAA